MSNKTSDENVVNIEIIKVIQHIISFYKDLDVIHSNDKCKEIVALENILAELEQKDKQIKELEEENERKDKFIKMAKEVIDNSILKQVVIDKIDELKLSGGSDGKDNVENLVRELTIDILQELLEGGGK